MFRNFLTNFKMKFPEELQKGIPEQFLRLIWLSGEHIWREFPGKLSAVPLKKFLKKLQNEFLVNPLMW